LPASCTCASALSTIASSVSPRALEQHLLEPHAVDAAGLCWCGVVEPGPERAVGGLDDHRVDRPDQG
jgi:hypothetical protein